MACARCTQSSTATHCRRLLAEKALGCRLVAQYPCPGNYRNQSISSRSVCDDVPDSRNIGCRSPFTHGSRAVRSSRRRAAYSHQAQPALYSRTKSVVEHAIGRSAASTHLDRAHQCGTSHHQSERVRREPRPTGSSRYGDGSVRKRIGRGVRAGDHWFGVRTACRPTGRLREVPLRRGLRIRQHQLRRQDGAGARRVVPLRRGERSRP